jgi:toxin ParE1/3/4
MVKINWTERAINDLHDIADYISKDSIRYAQLMVERLFNHPNSLKSQPRLGRIVPEFEEEVLRELILGNYRIVYKIVNDFRIDIITVHHSARLLNNK